MIAVLEVADAPEGPPDLLRARRRTLDAWLSVNGEALTVVDAGSVSARGANARLVVREPGCCVPSGGLERAAPALARNAWAAVAPAGFYGGAPAAPPAYAAVWELERIADVAPAESHGPVAVAPVELRREDRGRGDGAIAFGGWLVHSFAGRRSHARPEVAALVPLDAARVLEVGCAEGALGAALQAAGAEVTGIEPDPAAAAVAERRLARVVSAPIEEALRDLGRFDAVVAADVLEHLEDPVGVLRELRARCGVLVASVPNATHAGVLGGLLQGRWDPALEGIVADDHRTYAGLTGWCRLLAAAGWNVERSEPVTALGEEAARWLPALSRARPVAELGAVQWLLVARPAGSAGTLELGASGRETPRALDWIDPLGSARRAGGLHVEVGNAAGAGILETLLGGDIVTGASRMALVDGWTRRSLSARFATLGVMVAPSTTAPLPPCVGAVADAAASDGLPVARDDLGSQTLRMTVPG